MVSRRLFLLSGVSTLAVAGGARGQTISGKLPWAADSGDVIEPIRPGPLKFFTVDEAKLVDAIVDTLIPPDELGVGGVDAGCTVFIDRQLAGPYGRADGLYMQPPFATGLPSQGIQFQDLPTQRYRVGLIAFDAAAKASRNASFIDMSADERAAFLRDVEAGKVSFESGVDGSEFFELVLADTQAGYFADPIYGGNRDMVSWKLIGFPGARYDYRDWIHRHNEPYPHPPVSLAGRPEWTVK